MKTSNIKFIIGAIALLLNLNLLWSQNTLGKSDDLERIALATYIPPQLENIPQGAKSLLMNKLSQIATQNGMGGSYANERFIITANIDILAKEVTPTAPPMYAYTMVITFYVGDGIDGIKFASYSLNTKGVGETETKAYINALRNLKPSDPAFQSLLDKGKSRIIEFYNSKCDFIIKESHMLSSQNKYDEAIYKLSSVPKVCKECYSKCMTQISPIYKKKIDRDGSMLLMQAKSLWVANQNSDGANQAAAVLSKIEPSAACFGEVKSLLSDISARVKDIDHREWQYTLQEQVQASESISAIRDISVAYAKNQQQTITYNVSGWW